jgi:hypothetical protein
MVLGRRSSCLLLLAASLLTACSSRSYLHKYQFQDGYYQYRQGKEPLKRVYISVAEDSAKIFHNNEQIQIRPGVDQLALKHSFDFDVMIVPFKYRPAAEGAPRALHADANGAMFVGWRVDRFKIKYLNTPSGAKRIPLHRGLAIGAFAGLGATPVTPWTTNYQTQDEYQALVLSRGIAGLVGVNNLTFGIGIGWDYLTDRDKNIWIYQNRPWWGITVGLNLN